MLNSKEQIVSYTDSAATKLKEIMKEQNNEDNFLRVSINENEHGGFEYVFGLLETTEKDDTIIDGEIKTVVDSESVKFVEGSNIDYVEGFQRSGFVISNPNLQTGGCGGGACGCGGGEQQPTGETQCCGGNNAGQGCCQG